MNEVMAGGRVSFLCAKAHADEAMLVLGRFFDAPTVEAILKDDSLLPTLNAFLDSDGTDMASLEALRLHRGRKQAATV